MQSQYRALHYSASRGKNRTRMDRPTKFTIAIISHSEKAETVIAEICGILLLFVEILAINFQPSAIKWWKRVCNRDVTA